MSARRRQARGAGEDSQRHARPADPPLHRVPRATGLTPRSKRRAPRSQQLVAQLPSGARGNLLQATPVRLSPSFPAASPNRSAERQRRFSCAVSAQSTPQTRASQPGSRSRCRTDFLLLRRRPLAATLSARNLARGTGEQDQRRAARRPARRVPNTPRTQRRPRDYPKQGASLAFERARSDTTRAVTERPVRLALTTFAPPDELLVEPCSRG